MSADTAAKCRRMKELWEQKTAAVDAEAKRRRTCEATVAALNPTVLRLTVENQQLAAERDDLRDSRNRWAAVAVVAATTVVGIVAALFIRP